MPAKSKAQQEAAGAALSAKRGETKPSELYGSSKDMYDSMSEEELEEFASTTRKGKPEKNRINCLFVYKDASLTKLASFSALTD